MLVFLPGKAEIRRVAAAMPSWAEVVELHGGLTLAQQGRVFRPGRRRRVVLATNVAETSLTIPRISTVIDAGLVRRTVYRGGRGHLTLLPVAADSADQRAGRAGRLGPGRCLRLWSPAARLDAITPPEIRRESLVPLVLAAANCGAATLDLPWLDLPKPYAVDAAREILEGLGALDATGELTRRGRRVFGLPLDPHLARLLIEGEQRGASDVVIPLCAALAVDRPLFRRGPRADEDLRESGCDATALVAAVDHGEPETHHLDPKALADARKTAARLRKALGVQRGVAHLDRRALAEVILAAWPDCAHVARRRKREVAWANGGTELVLGRESAVDTAKTDLILVLDSRAFTIGHRRDVHRITAATPVPAAWVVAAGRGCDRLAGAQLVRGQLVTRVERVYARRVLATREEPPVGALAREAIRDLFVRGSLFRDAHAEAQRRHGLRALNAALEGRRERSFEDATLARLEALGVEEAADLSLLSGDDLLPELLPPEVQADLERRFPLELSTGDAVYRIDYDPPTRTATLVQTGGTRREPPPASFLPRLPGWRIRLDQRKRIVTLRPR